MVAVKQLLPRVDVEIHAGRPMVLRVSLLNGAGAPLDAGSVASARVQVRQDVDNPSVLVEFSTEADPPTIAITTGQAEITATSDETSGWATLWPGRAPATTVWWDLEVTDDDGESWQMTDASLFTVVHQVTRTNDPLTP